MSQPLKSPKHVQGHNWIAFQGSTYQLLSIRIGIWVFIRTLQKVAPSTPMIQQVPTKGQAFGLNPRNFPSMSHLLSYRGVHNVLQQWLVANGPNYGSYWPFWHLQTTKINAETLHNFMIWPKYRPNSPKHVIVVQCGSIPIDWMPSHALFGPDLHIQEGKCTGGEVWKTIGRSAQTPSHTLMCWIPCNQHIPNAHSFAMHNKSR